MPIRDYQYAHGAAIAIAINAREYQSITKLPNSPQSEYLLNNDAALYMKAATEDDDSENKWNFWFTPAHQNNVRQLFERCGDRTFIVLICQDDGICLLRYGDYATCLDENFEENEWLEVTRPNGGGFRVRGRRGELDHVIPLSDYPRQLFE